jgi:hypothetical protein
MEYNAFTHGRLIIVKKQTSHQTKPAGVEFIWVPDVTQTPRVERAAGMYGNSVILGRADL